MDLYIEQHNKDYYIAFTQQAEEKKYVLGLNKKPLKFLSVHHVKEYFEGYKFTKISLPKSNKQLVKPLG